MNTFRRILLGKMFSDQRDEKTDLCAGCVWKDLKRHQKCSTCRRNQNMKDNYEPILRGGSNSAIQTAHEGGVERE